MIASYFVYACDKNCCGSSVEGFLQGEEDLALITCS